MQLGIVLEGFRQSIMAMHYLIYHKLVGDGDSSVLKKNILANPYVVYDIDVKKIECPNHILRNYINRIVEMTTRRKSSRGDMVPGVLWKVLKDKRLKLRYNFVYNLYIILSI